MNYILLDGKSSLVRLPISATKNLAKNWSFTVWINTKENKSSGTVYQNPCIIGTGGAGYNRDVAFFTQSGFLGVYCESVSNFSSFVSTKKINDGEWHYIALTYDGKVFELYCDNHKVGSLSFSMDFLNQENYFMLGASHAYRYSLHSPEPNSFHQGKFFYPVFYSKTLTLEQLIENQFKNFSENESEKESVTFATLFETQDSKTSTDLKGNKFTLINIEEVEESPIKLDNIYYLIEANNHLHSIIDKKSTNSGIVHLGEKKQANEDEFLSLLKKNNMFLTSSQRLDKIFNKEYFFIVGHQHIDDSEYSLLEVSLGRKPNFIKIEE